MVSNCTVLSGLLMPWCAFGVWILDRGSSAGDEPLTQAKPAVQHARDDSSNETSLVSWDSAKRRSIERAWVAKRASSDVRADDPSDIGTALLADLLKKELAKYELRQLAASFASLHADDEFGHALRDATIDVFLESADREGLVILLAANCPSRVFGQHDIEFYIVQFAKGMNDSVLILGEAYSKASSPVVRGKIADAVRRGFSGSAVRGTDDDRFVKNAMQWYSHNKDRLTLNGAYSLNAATGGGYDYKQNPLFKMKRDVKKGPE